LNKAFIFLEESRPPAQLYEGQLSSEPGPASAEQNSQSADAQDRRLLKRSAHGDARAFHELVDRHAPRLFRLAHSMLGNFSDAQDVLQETWIGAFKGARGFEGRSTVKTWLTRICIIQVAKWRRERKTDMPLADVVEELSGSESAGDKRMDIQNALRKLSEEHRQVIVLRELERMTYEEMAEVLDVPRGTVESRLHRARAELREKLKNYLEK
jgi:RNA polymerase sigma-70 factor (ECF subfamily)